MWRFLCMGLSSHYFKHISVSTETAITSSLGLDYIIF